jgi:hypothetical protein
MAAYVVGLVFLAVLLAVAIRVVWEGKAFSGVLLAIGAFGFCAPFILPVAGNLLRHVELPAFYETAAIVGPGGQTFTLTQHLARLQRYDKAGHFEAGWFVDSKGGAVSLGTTTDGKIAVAAARSRRVEFFNPDGTTERPSMEFTRATKELMGRYLEPSEYRVDGATFETPVVVNNPAVRWNTLLLLPLWNPVIAWLLLGGGIVAAVIAGRGKLWSQK